MKAIPISPQYGVNPGMSACFFCGSEKSELCLYGRLKGDAKAPMHTLINYEPCEQCKKRFQGSVVMMAVTETPVVKELPPITAHGLFPTGAYMVVDNADVEKLYGMEAAKPIIEAGTVLMSQEDLIKTQERLRKEIGQ